MYVSSLCPTTNTFYRFYSDCAKILFVGPFDLGNNIGHPVMGDFDPELKAAISRIREAAKAAGKWSAIYVPNGDVARQYADEGFNMVCVVDVLSILRWLTIDPRSR